MPAPKDPCEWSEEVVAEWVRASCAAQGVPERVEDQAVLRDVCTLMGKTGTELAGAAERRTASEARTRAAARPPSSDVA